MTARTKLDGRARAVFSEAIKRPTIANNIAVWRALMALHHQYIAKLEQDAGRTTGAFGRGSPLVPQGSPYSADDGYVGVGGDKVGRWASTGLPLTPGVKSVRFANSDDHVQSDLGRKPLQPMHPDPNVAAKDSAHEDQLYRHAGVSRDEFGPGTPFPPRFRCDAIMEVVEIRDYVPTPIIG